MKILQKDINFGITFDYNGELYYNNSYNIFFKIVDYKKGTRLFHKIFKKNEKDKILFICQYVRNVFKN